MNLPTQLAWGKETGVQPAEERTGGREGGTCTGSLQLTWGMRRACSRLYKAHLGYETGVQPAAVMMRSASRKLRKREATSKS